MILTSIECTGLTKLTTKDYVGLTKAMTKLTWFKWPQAQVEAVPIDHKLRLGLPVDYNKYDYKLADWAYHFN